MSKTTTAKILIVEDESITALDIRKRLQGLGYNVVATTSSGEDALAMVGQFRPDLVLMDIVLKGSMDGVRAAAEIRSRHGIPVVYLTAFSDNDTLQRAKVTEPFGYVLKPFEERDLHSTIELALYKHLMEEKQRQIEERYRMFSELASDYVYSASVNGDVIETEWVAGGFQRVTGYTLEGLKTVGGWLSIVHPDDAAGALENLQDALKDSGGEVEYRIITKTGEIRWLHDYLRPVWDEQHLQVIRIVGGAQDVTERKRAEDALRASSERQELLLRSIPMAFYTACSTGEMETTWISHQIEPITGFAPNQFVDDTTFWSRHLHPDDRDRAIGEYEAIHRKGSIANEYRWRCGDGTYHWFLDLTVLVHNPRLGRDEIIGAWLDITERKKTEVALLESQNRMTKLNNCMLSFGPDPYENISRLVALCGEQLGATAALYNRAERDYLFSVGHWNAPSDYNLMDKAEGHICYDVIHRKQSDPCVIRNLSESTYAKTDPNVCRYGLKTYVGKAVSFADTFIGSLCVVYQHDHEPSEGDLKLLGVAAAAIGVEESRKQAEEKITMLAHTVRSIGEAVSITDMDNRILFVNEAFLKTYGYDEHELIGKSIEIVRSVNDQSFDVPTILAGTKSGGWQGELLNRRKDGTEFPIRLSTSMVHDENGHAIALVGVAQDIEERKRAEQDRTELEDQLRQAQKLESLGTLAGGIAHDFNNILGIILGHITLLNEMPHKQDNLARRLEAIAKAADRGVGLVGQLLTFARKTDVKIESVQVNDTIVEVSKLFTETFPKTITMTARVEPRLPSIIADANQIHQVLVNLCVNARDAMPGGGELSLATRLVSGEFVRSRFHKAHAREYAQVTVQDTGTGMDETTRARIFEPFFTTKSVGKGTGLGLAVVFGIVQNHEGFIDVRSKPGRGTSFDLFFPVEVQNIESSRQNERDYKATEGGSETILLVEDEIDLRDMVESVLTDKGYKVHTAADGIEAVEVYAKQWKEIDLVITDVGLPKLDGKGVFGRMQALNPNARVIVASGYVEPAEKSSLLLAGAKYFLQKPYKPQEILTSVRAVLDM